MIHTRVLTDMGGGVQWYWRTGRVANADYVQPQADWPAPDPTTRVPMHGCDWIECPRTDTKRYGYWGQYIYGCPEHGPLVGDDGSMDDDEVFICPVCKGTRTIQPDRASPPEECPRCVDPDEGA